MQQYLRKATIEDMDLLFQWANDPVVRKNSFSTAEISYEEHTKWYHNLLKRWRLSGWSGAHYIKRR